MSSAKVSLGRHLFYDPRLSGNGSQSCASCHEQARAFSDGKAAATGSTGEHLTKNSMALSNVAYAVLYTWANPLLRSLESQALVPLFSDAPTELDATSAMPQIQNLLRRDTRYQRLFREAFPGEDDPFQAPFVAQALASFERTLLSFDSPFDRYQRGETQALSPAAARGYLLFQSEKLACGSCHSGANLSVAFPLPGSEVSEVFFNTGLYNLVGGGYPNRAPGLVEFTRRKEDQGKFRVPSLRNIAVTAPYMHDGSVPSLEAVIAHYAAGGQNLGHDAVNGTFTPAREPNPYRDPRIPGFSISPQETEELLAFLHSLTDSEFLTRAELSNPFTESHMTTLHTRE